MHKAHKVAARFSSAFHGALGSLTTWNDSRMTRNTLSSLSNRELEDIGLTRADIDRVANGR